MILCFGVSCIFKSDNSSGLIVNKIQEQHCLWLGYDVMASLCQSAFNP